MTDQNPKPNTQLRLAEEVALLLKLPQHLCKQRGMCCRVATFRGSLSHEQIGAMAADPSHPLYMHARDFHSIFLPYPDEAAVRAIADGFVERVRKQTADNGGDPDNISYFHCKYVQEDGRCGVHEDRPTGCRAYPFPHESTVYHPGCGFEQRGVENWNRISEILVTLGLTPKLTPADNNIKES